MNGRVQRVVSCGIGLMLWASLIGVAAGAQASVLASPAVRGVSAGVAAPLITSVGPEGLGILVEWVPPSAGTGVTSYGLKAVPELTSGVPASCRAPVTVSVPGADTMTIMSRACAHVAYLVSIRALTARGASLYSKVSDPVVPLPASAPLLPLLGTVLGRDHSLVVTWAPPAYDGGTPVKSYQIAAASGASTKTVTASAAARSTTITGLKNAVAYTVQLRAVNTVGKSPASAGRGTPAGPHAPGVPASLSALPGSAAGTMKVSWAAPADNGGDKITSYRLTWLKEVAKAKGKTVVYVPAPGAKPVSRNVTGTSAVIRGLSTGPVFYVFRVAARSAAGSSAATKFSVPVTLRTAASANSRIITSSILSHLRSYANGILTFAYPSSAAAPAVLKTLRTGDVIVGGVSAMTPDGLLRTVTAVKARKAGRFVFATSAAPLSAAFRALTADVSVGGAGPLGQAMSGGHFIPAGPGVSVRQLPQAGGSTTLGLSFDFSVAGQGSRGGLTLDVQGQADLTPAWNLDTSVLPGLFGLPSNAAMSFTASLAGTESHTISVSGSADQHWPLGSGTGIYPPAFPNVKPQVGKYCYRTFDVQIGPVPLVLTPCVELTITLSVTGQVGVTSSSSFLYAEQASWSSAKPSALNLTTSQAAVPLASSPPSSSKLVQGQVSLGLEAKPELFLYGITGPFIDIDIALVATVTPAARPWFTLDLQFTVSAGWQIHIPVLHIDVQVQAQLSKVSHRLYQSTGPPPRSLLPPLALSPQEPTVDPGTPRQFTAPGAVGKVTWSLSGQAGDTVSSTGLFTAAQPTGRVVTVIATDTRGATGLVVVTIGGAIGPPQHLTDTVSTDGAGVILIWQPPVPVPGQAVASYTVSTSPPTVVTSLPGTATGTTISDLTPGIDYVVSVAAWTAGGYESQPATVTISTPSATGCKTLGRFPAGQTPSGPATMTPDAGSATTWGCASDIPSIAALNKNGSAGITLMSCPSTGNCGAGGYYFDKANTIHFVVLGQVNGAWGTAIDVPGLHARAVGGFDDLNGLSCGSPGNCSVGGDFYDGHKHQAFVASQVRGTWGSVLPVPGALALAGGGDAGIEALSCPSAAYCGAAGFAGDGLVDSQVNGTWEKAVDIPGTATIDAPLLRSVSCPSAGNCSAGGDDGEDAEVVDEVGGTWTSVQQVPGTVALNKHRYASTTSMSCASPGNCGAAGFYSDASNHLQVFVVSEVNGTWGKAIEAPGTATLNAGGNAIINSISCPSPGDCSAVGNYTDASRHQQVFAVSEVNGTWAKAIEIPGTATLNAKGSAVINSVSCGSPGNCSAGGDYTNSDYEQLAFLVSQVHGNWGKAVNVPGLPVSNTYEEIWSVSCAPVGSCSAGGFYQDSSDHIQAFVVSGH